MPPNFDDILRTIEQSDPKNDWVGVLTEEKLDYYVYKDDVNLRITENKKLDENERELFQESWLNTLPDGKAYRYFYRIYFNSSILSEIMLISVDGARALIPLPVSQNNLKIKSSLDLVVAQIVDELGTLDEYLERLKLTK